MWFVIVWFICSCYFCNCLSFSCYLRWCLILKKVRYFNLKELFFPFGFNEFLMYEHFVFVLLFNHMFLIFWKMYFFGDFILEFDDLKCKFFILLNVLKWIKKKLHHYFWDWAHPIFQLTFSTILKHFWSAMLLMSLIDQWDWVKNRNLYKKVR